MVYGMQILPQVTEKEPLVITEDVPTAGAASVYGLQGNQPSRVLRFVMKSVAIF